MPDGASTDRTEDVVVKFTKAIEDIEGIDKAKTLAFDNGISNQATMVINLTPWEERNLNIFQKIYRLATGRPTNLSHVAILKKIKEQSDKINEASIATFSPPAIDGMSMLGGFEYQLLSTGEASVQDIEKVANDFIVRANQDKSLRNVYTQFQANVPQYMLHLNYEKALAQDVDLDEFQKTLSSTIAPMYVNDFNKLGRVFRVFMQAEGDFRNKIEDLHRLNVINKSGAKFAAIA